MRARARIAFALFFASISIGATPGDIGGCGQPAEDLDPAIFFATLAFTDCQTCMRCGFRTATCDDACSNRPLPQSFALGCAPLAHDGEVCLRRLQESSCSEYAPYVADANGQAVPIEDRPRPSECNFCPPP